MLFLKFCNFLCNIFCLSFNIQVTYTTLIYFATKTIAIVDLYLASRLWNEKFFGLDVRTWMPIAKGPVGTKHKNEVFCVWYGRPDQEFLLSRKNKERKETAHAITSKPTY